MYLTKSDFKAAFDCRTKLFYRKNHDKYPTLSFVSSGMTRRGDDNVETLKLRMREYQEKTEPVVAHYRELGLLRPVDSTRTPDLVFASIAGILEGQ